jgi:hypothetical protein
MMKVSVNLFKNVKREGTTDKSGGGKDFSEMQSPPKKSPSKKELQEQR